MFSLDKQLLPDEKILYRTKKHYILFLVPALLTLFAIAFLFSANHFVQIAAALPAIAALFSWLNQYLIYITSDFAVTTKRVIMREGFFYKHTNNTRLSTIANVSMDQSLLGQFLNYGTVVLHAFGGDADPFTQIASPIEFQKALQMQLDRTNHPT